jgi:copper resistance protein C
MSTLIRHRFLARGLAVLAITTALWSGAATLAHAHSGLESSTPADGSVISEAPAAITLTFNETLLEDADSISLNSADGTSIVSSKVQPSGNTVELPWPADLLAGDYQVAYRVVSADGHPVTGAISFSYTGSPVASSSPVAEPSASQGSAVPISEPSSSAVPISETTEPESTGGNPWLGLGIGVAIGLLLVVIFAAMRRKRA